MEQMLKWCMTLKYVMSVSVDIYKQHKDNVVSDRWQIEIKWFKEKWFHELLEGSSLEECQQKFLALLKEHKLL